YASSSSFCAYALAHGASCVSGSVQEPYLSGVSVPMILTYYMLKGYSFAEASTLATPSIGWMPLNVGDPLYTPFASKTPVVDTQFPALASGYPKVTGNLALGAATVNVCLQDTPYPEV